MLFEENEKEAFPKFDTTIYSIRKPIANQVLNCR